MIYLFRKHLLNSYMMIGSVKCCMKQEGKRVKKKMKKMKKMKRMLSWVLVLAMCQSPIAYAADSTGALSPGEEQAEQQLAAELRAYSEQYPNSAFAFYQSEDVEITEGDNAVLIDIVRLGEPRGEASVDLKAVDVTTMYGEDYEIKLKKSFFQTQNIEKNEDASPLADLTIDQENLDEAQNEKIQDETETEQDESEHVSEEVTEVMEESELEKKAPTSIDVREEADSEIESETVSTEINKEVKDKKAGEEPYSLRKAKAVQTGVQSDQTDWRGALIEEKARKEAEEVLEKQADNKLIDALPGSDITLLFEDGEYKKTLILEVKDDNISENDEMATLLLGNAVNAELGESMQRKLTIHDNDENEPIIFAMKYGAVKSEVKDGEAQVLIQRTSGFGKYAMVQVSTASKTAISNEDYIPISNQEITFKAGEEEKAVSITLPENATDGSQFYVEISGTEIEEGRGKTLVTITKENELSAETGTVEKELTIEEPEIIEENTAKGFSSNEVTLNGLKYMQRNYTGWGALKETREDYSRWHTYNQSSYYDLEGATKTIVDWTLSGYDKFWGVKYYSKYGEIFIGGKKVFWHDLGDSKSNQTRNFIESADINSDQRKHKEFIKLGVRAYYFCHTTNLQTNSVKILFPNYTINFSQGNNVYKSKIYTGPNSSTQGNIITLGSYSSNNIGTLKKGGSVRITPNNVNPNAYIDHYEVKADQKVVGIIGGDKTSITYRDVAAFLNNHQSAIINSKYKLTIEPIYSVYPAQVRFLSQNSTLIGYKNGFKTGDTLKNNVKVLDKIKVTGAGEKGFKTAKITMKTLWEKNPKSISDKSLLSNESRAGNEVTGKLDQGETTTFSDLKSYNYITVFHAEPTLKIEYDQDQIADKESSQYEESITRAGAGAISLSKKNGNENQPIGTLGTWKDIINIKSGLNLSTMYQASFIPGEEALKVQDGNRPYVTTWTYKDKNTKKNVTVKGNVWNFNLFEADTSAKYFFQRETKNIKPAVIKGKVTTKESPLFSSSQKIVETPAVGAVVNLGGEIAYVDDKGYYSLTSMYSRATNISGFVQYGSLSNYMDMVVADTEYNISLNTNSNDGIIVDTAEIFKDVKTVSGGIISSLGGKYVSIRNEKVSCVYDDDTNYTFKLETKGNGDIIPKQAIFRFYTKEGKLRNATSTVESDVRSPGYFEYKMNPKSLGLQPGDSMTVQFNDSKGNSYYEHHTMINVAEADKGSLYMFHHEKTNPDMEDSIVMKIMGTISMGASLGVDSLSSSFGTAELEDGSIHEILGFGFGSDFDMSGKTQQESASNARDTLYKVINDIKNAGTTKEKFDHKNSMSIFSGTDSGAGAFGIELQVGILMDRELGDGTNNTEKGSWYFNDFVVAGKANVDYERDMVASLGPVSFYLDFSFKVRDTGISWHFENIGDKKYKLGSGSTLMLLTDDNIKGEGQIKIDAEVLGKAYAGLGASSFLFVGIGGKVKVIPQASFAYSGETSNTWKESGRLTVIPTVAIKASILEIPLWTDSFNWSWGDGKRSNEVPSLQSAIDEVNPLETATANKTVADRSYLKNESEWLQSNAGSRVRTGDEMINSLRENVLKEGIYPGSKIQMQDLGNGRYLAVFTDDDKSRDDYNRCAVYYSVYNGLSWETPIMLEEDGTGDEVPTVCDAGSKGYLIAWSSANRKATASDQATELLNLYDIHGVFYDSQANKIGEIMEITKSTKWDTSADANPKIVSYGEGSEQTLMVYYTKSEYSISDEQEGEVAGDVLNPYTVIGCRFYDFDKDEWSAVYDAKMKETIMSNMGYATEEEFEEYQEQFYGQQFLSLAPAVTVEEKLDEKGYWSEEPTVTEYTGLNDPMIIDSNVISYNELSLMAYVMDNDGQSSTTDDRNVYLQIYNMKDKEFHNPVMLTGNMGNVSNLQFVRANDVTYLYWLEDGVIKSLDISTVVKNCLIPQNTSDGDAYYLVDKSDDDDNMYNPPRTITTSESLEEKIEVPDEDTETPDEEAGAYVENNEVIEENGNTAKTVADFTVKSAGNDIYVMWAQTLSKNISEEEQQGETQLYIIREKATESTREKSSPVQMTYEDAANYVDSDFIVGEDGSIYAMAIRQENGEDGTASEDTSKMVSLQMQTEKSAAFSDVEYGMSYRDEDEAGNTTVRMPATVSIQNTNVEIIENGVLTASDQNGKVFYVTPPVTDTDGENNANRINGGNKIRETFQVPLNADGSYHYTLTLADGDTEVITKEFRGNAPHNVSIEECNTILTGRDEFSFEANMTNNAVFASGDRTLTVGYMDSDKQEHELYTKKINSLESGENTVIKDLIKVDFDQVATSIYHDDGSVEAQLNLFVKTDAQDDNTKYLQLTKSASQSQMELINSIQSISTGLDNLEMEIGRTVPRELLINGNKIEGESPYTALKIVWVSDNPKIAAVDEDGVIIAESEGKTLIRGYIMPMDTDYEGTDSMRAFPIDNFNTLPAEAIKTIRTEVTVNKVTPIEPEKPIDLTNAVIGKVADQSYTAKAITPKVTVSVGNRALVKDVDYTISYKNNIKAGTATLTVQGKGKYTGSKDSNFRILRANISKAVKGKKIADQSYTDKKLKPSVTLTHNGKKLKVKTDYTVSYFKNKNIGTANVVIKGKGNYTGTRKATFKIVPGKVKSLKVSRRNKIVSMRWSKVKGSVRYSIFYATKKNGKYKKLQSVSAAGLSTKKLKSKKPYYIKVRAYKKVGKTYYRGKFSNVKKLK